MLHAEVVHVYFDYLCPFAWRGAELAEQVSGPLGLSFEWHHFSVFQSRYQGSDCWQLWNDRLELESENGCKGLLPFLASCAARKQGKAPFDRFRLALMRARYLEHLPLSYATILAVAERAGLQLYRFKHDLSDPERRTELAHEHYRASAMEILSTPTYRFAGGHLAHLRLKDLPKNQEEAVRLFSDYRRLLECYPYIETIQRPLAKTN